MLGASMDDSTGEYLTLTYVELGERLGITPDSARLKAKKKAARGEWQIVPPNREGGLVRVRVPLSALPEHPPERSPERPKNGLEPGVNGTPSVTELLAELGELKASIAELQEAHARAERTSIEIAEARLKVAVAEAERDASKTVATATVNAAQFAAKAELEAMRQQLETEVAARNAVIEEVKGALTHERARSERLEGMLAELRRPWWWRWLG
jgi:hypothetical protein